MMIDEVERYQKILEDWSWSAKPKGNKGSQQPEGRSVPAQPAGHVQRQPGAILCLDGRTIAIYKQAAPEKEYHLMLALFPNNQVKTQGIALEGHQVDEIGSLPPDMMERLQRDLRWNRDLIVFHCYSYDDVEKIPAQMAPPDAAATPERSETIAPAITLLPSAVKFIRARDFLRAADATTDRILAGELVSLVATPVSEVAAPIPPPRTAPPLKSSALADVTAA